MNAAGAFYVVNGECISCLLPEGEAPELMGMGDHCYFKRQPATSAEVENAIKAVTVSCCNALRYAGTDNSIILRLKQLNCGDRCDHG